jgi:hypothetical protein
VPVRDEVRVLCVAGRLGAARYVASALNPNPADSSPIRPVVVSEGELAEAQLADFDCVFLCNVAQLTASEAQRLRRYVENGGGLVVFLGDQVRPESYNAIRYPQFESDSPRSPVKPLLPAVIGALAANDRFGLDPLEYRHAIVAPFRGREQAGLLTTPVSRYFRLRLSESDPQAEVAAALPNGDPFIVAAPLGGGRTVLVATAGSLASVDAATGEPWTHWPTWPSFLPIVRELLAYAGAGRQNPRQQPVGATLAGRGLPAAGAGSRFDPAALAVLRPDGRTAAVSLHSDNTESQWTYGPTDVSGIYTLHGAPQDKALTFAVNVETSESDLAKVDPPQLPPELMVDGVGRLQADDRGEGDMQRTRSSWAPTLLWIALAMLLGESILAWLFGRGVV